MSGNGLRSTTSGAARRKKRHIESGHAIALMQWCNCRLVPWPDLKWFHAIPNGGRRGKLEACIMKAEGVKRGVWDYSFPSRRAQYVGLILELKKPDMKGKKNGGLTDEQVEYGEFMRAQGWLTVIAYHWNEAAEALTHYLRLPKP